MGTQSLIAVEHTDGTVSAIYCHYDGYLEHNGRILKEHYTTLERAEELVALGDLSVLGERITPTRAHSFNNPQRGTCVAYGRDRGEKDTAPEKFWDVKHFKMDADMEYNYLFTKGTWMWRGPNTKRAWHEIEFLA